MKSWYLTPADVKLNAGYMKGEGLAPEEKRHTLGIEVSTIMLFSKGSPLVQ